jgi:iron(III) transport system permease protein
VSHWRVVILGLLVLALGLPLALPLITLWHFPAGWAAILETGRIVALARNTGLLIASTLALSLPVGVVGAFLLYRTDLPGRSWFRWLTMATLFIPLPLFASGWQAALGSGGWLALPAWTTAPPGDPDLEATGMAWKPWAHGLLAASWIHAVAGLPWIILVVGSGLTWIERELEEDALMSAGAWFVLRRVTLVRCRAALAAAAIWVALQTATEITVTDMMQVRTFAEEVYNQIVQPDVGNSSDSDKLALARVVAVSLPASLVTLVLVLFAVWRWQRNLPRLERRSLACHVFTLGYFRWPGFLVTLAVVVILLGIPIGSLLWKAGIRSPSGWSFPTLAYHLANVGQTRGRLVMESLAVALVAGVVCGPLALVSCWLAGETPWLQFTGLGVLALIWAMPGPLIGLGLKQAIFLLLDTLGWPPLVADALYYGPSLVPVLWVDVLRFFPAAVALLWPVVRQLPRELLDSARVDGLRPWGEFRRVVWPLTRATCLRAILVVGVLALGELSAGKLVEAAGSTTFTHQVFAQMHYGVTNDLAALCLVLLGTVFAGAMAVIGAGRLLQRTPA